MKIFDDFYVYLWRGRDNNCNSCVFANVLPGGKHVVVDPGHIQTPSYREPGIERLAENMISDGIDFSDIGLVILTHGHPDHCEAAALLQQQLHAQVAMHQADEEMFQMLGAKVDFYLQDGELALGKNEGPIFQVLHSPGHSRGHLTLYWPKRKTLIAGDCIFYHSTGRTDFPGGSSDQLRQSIERISRLDIEYLLCGHPYGHPGLIRGNDNVRENFEIILGYK